VRVRVVAFARLRELLGGPSHDVELPQGASAQDVWNSLLSRCNGIAELAESTRIARNGRIVMRTELLSDGDEVALLPPVGGG
jgi:molybdopterin converting factor small subunit